MFFLYTAFHTKGYTGHIFWDHPRFTTIMVRYVFFSQKYTWNTMNITYAKIKKKFMGSIFQTTTSSTSLNSIIWLKLTQKIIFKSCNCMYVCISANTIISSWKRLAKVSHDNLLKTLSNSISSLNNVHSSWNLYNTWSYRYYLPWYNLCVEWILPHPCHHHLYPGLGEKNKIFHCMYNLISLFKLTLRAGLCSTHHGGKIWCSTQLPFYTHCF